MSAPDVRRVSPGTRRDDRRAAATTWIRTIRPSTGPARGAPPRRRESDRALSAPPPGAPTPIWISPRTRNVLILVGIVALVLLVYYAPSVLTLALGGAALALVLSFPVRLLTRIMPKGWAIATSFLGVLALVVLGVAYIVPIAAEQLGTLSNAIPAIVDLLDARLPTVLEWLDAHGLLPTTPELFLERLQQNLSGRVQGFVRGLLGGLGQFVSRLVGFAVALFGIIFLAVYFLADARRIEAASLRAAPHRYRRDVRDLWDAFRFTLSRYIGGLCVSLAIQGVLSAAALYFLGVPYPILLGAWVSVTALVPYLGAWIGAIPAVLLALTVSPTTALLTTLLYLAIQQLESNVLTPRIQGQAVHVHPILIFLAVVAGGALFGIVGILFAVPVVAVLRVLFDFFRARLRVRDERALVRVPL